MDLRWGAVGVARLGPPGGIADTAWVYTVSACPSARPDRGARAGSFRLQIATPQLHARMIPATKLIPALAPIVGGTAVLVWRFQETRTPVSAKKILIPPLGMSTGFGMFVVPAMRIPWSYAVVAFLIGALVLSVPLARTSSLHREGDVILMRRSHGFLLILLALLALRLLLHDYVGRYLSARQTAAVFFVLAFGMIIRWRTGMYRRYLALVREVGAPGPSEAAGAAEGA